MYKKVHHYALVFIDLYEKLEIIHDFKNLYALVLSYKESLLMILIAAYQPEIVCLDKLDLLIVLIE